jgi:hypothetical protein
VVEEVVSEYQIAYAMSGIDCYQALLTKDGFIDKDVTSAEGSCVGIQFDQYA